MTITVRRSRWNAMLLVAAWCQLSFAGFRGIAFARVAEIETPTVTAVQGDLFDSADTASKILWGCPYECQEANPQIDCSCRKAVYHVPDLWVDKEQIHLDNRSDYSCFYRDKRAKDGTGTPGEDESTVHGLEQSQITFYAGHGTPEYFFAIEGKRVSLGDFSLGDVNTRYLFMTSCNVFAHGPRSRGGDFSSPNLFDATRFRVGQRLAGAASEMANVFYSWGRDYGEGLGLYPLNPSLRLACGGSSLIGGAEEYGGYPTHLFWYYLSLRRLNPADAWLVGLYVPGEAEPLCMSRGDSLKASGLGDPWFETAPLVAGAPPPPKFVYIEYPVEGKAGDPLVRAASSGVPVQPVKHFKQPAEAAGYPVLPVTPTSVPSILKGKPQGGASLGYGFRGGAASAGAPGLLPTLFPPSPVAGGSVIKAEDVCVEENPASGSVAISWRPYAALDNPDLGLDLDTAATEFLLRLMALFKKEEEQQVSSDEKEKTSVQGVTAIQMKVDAVEAAALLTRPEPQDGCLYLRQTRSVEVGQAEPPVRIFGEGSETFIGRCPAAALRLEPPAPPQARTNPCERAGSPLATFVYTNRGIGKADAAFARVALKKKKAVIEEARSKLGLPADQANRYNPEEPRLGYRAAPAHCVQDKMYLVYEVDFKADDPQLPSRTIEVPAQDLPEAKSMEKAWDCSPE